METIDDVVAQNIKIWLKRLGMTQKELADRAKLSVVGVNKILKGHRRPSRATVEAIAAVLGCTALDLYSPPVDRARTRALEKMAGVAEPAHVYQANANYTFDFESEDVSLGDALALNDAYRKAKPLFRAFVVALLTADSRHLASFPAAREQLPGLGAILKTLQRGR